MDNNNGNNNQNQNNNNNNNNNNRNNNGMTLLIFILAALVVLFIASMISSGINRMTNQKISYTEFKEMVENDEVAQVEFESGLINIIPKAENGQMPLITYYAVQLDDPDILPLLDEHGVDYEGIRTSATTSFLYNILSFVIPIAICWVLLAFVMRRMGGGGGVMGVGKSNAKVYVEKQTGVTFKDVAGQDEAKESLQEVVDFLHNPKKYTEIGAKLPKGALLVGPPGTGKTLLAKAVAGEAKVPFFSLAGSDFVEMFVGVGASRVRDLFKEAQKNAPCIIFIDEIDAIGKSRDARYGGNDEREQTLNQLLAEMDGFDTSKGILILAATNRPDVLDKALLRPGRFDRRIIVDKPDLKGRKETLRVHSKNVLMDDSVDLDAIALATSGAVGSDLANMINEAAINAVKHGRKYVNQEDLFESVEVVIAGKEKKDRIMGPKEKKLVAYHEVGHALVTALQKDTEPVQKITIIPRTKGALGYTLQTPEEEKFLMTKNELVAHLVTYMGGRAAEEIVFDSVTTGASNDIEQATKIARAMVTQYGMSEKFGLMGLETVESQYLDGRASLNCGEETASQIDKEVMKILQESYEKAKELLLENRSIMDEIAEYLYEHETITGKEFMKIFRRLKGIPEPPENEERDKESHITFKQIEPVAKEEKPKAEKPASVKEEQPAKADEEKPKAEQFASAEEEPTKAERPKSGQAVKVDSEQLGEEEKPKKEHGSEQPAKADEEQPKEKHSKGEHGLEQPAEAGKKAKSGQAKDGQPQFGQPVKVDSEQLGEEDQPKAEQPASAEEEKPKEEKPAKTDEEQPKGKQSKGEHGIEEPVGVGERAKSRLAKDGQPKSRKSSKVDGEQLGGQSIENEEEEEPLDAADFSTSHQPISKEEFAAKIEAFLKAQTEAELPKLEEPEVEAAHSEEKDSEPEAEAPKLEEAKPEEPKPEEPEAEKPKVEEQDTEAPKPEEPMSALEMLRRMSEKKSDEE